MRFNFNYDGITLDLTLEFTERDYTEYIDTFVDVGTQLDPSHKCYEWADKKTRIVHDFVEKYCNTFLHNMLDDDMFSDRIFVEINDRGQKNYFQVEHCAHSDDIEFCREFLGCKIGLLVNGRQLLCEKCGHFYVEGHHKICLL